MDGIPALEPETQAGLPDPARQFRALPSSPLGTAVFSELSAR